MFNIDGELVNVDVRSSRYPIKSVSKSKLQKMVGERLSENYPYEAILEDFVIPGSKMSVDFFVPRRGIVVEIQGRQHSEHIPFFHGDRKQSDAYAKQQIRDTVKSRWAESNGFKFIEIRSEQEMERLDERRSITG
jgi:hypothetical protein